MKANYDYCLGEVLKWEGGYTNHPADKGGPTNFGITIHDYRMYVNPTATALDVKNMKLDDAKTIYRIRYWDLCQCDALPDGLDYTVFDFAVNSGVKRSISYLQQAAGCDLIDGIMGPRTLHYTLLKDPIELINTINTWRLLFLTHLKIWKFFGKGWGKRVKGVKADSLIMANDH